MSASSGRDRDDEQRRGKCTKITHSAPPPTPPPLQKKKKKKSEKRRNESSQLLELQLDRKRAARKSLL